MRGEAADGGEGEDDAVGVRGGRGGGVGDGRSESGVAGGGGETAAEGAERSEVGGAPVVPDDVDPRLFAHRIAEALLFAAATPLSEAAIAARLPAGVDVGAVMADLATLYEGRGVTLVRVAGQWMFRTAEDLGFLLRHEMREQRKLSRAALETLAIVAYHQPVTRAEVEEIRGVSTVKGSMDVLMEIGWVRMRGRRRSPGRPVTYGTTEAFLVHFGLDALADLPGLDELKGAGLLEGTVPPGFSIPSPKDGLLADDEDPLDDDALGYGAPGEGEGEGDGDGEMDGDGDGELDGDAEGDAGGR